ncbi:acyl-CoA carboxylase epsilon subunit [Salinifilum ghardaiensis]
MADNDTGAGAGDGAHRPELRVVRGNPDDAEIAALVAALSGAAAGSAAAPETGPERLNRWGARDTQLRWPHGRRPLRPGPDGWRASALPR